MMMLGYSLLLSLGLLVSAPWWLFRMVTTERYRQGLSERLGAVPVRLRRAVAGKRVMWVHAVSVGEVLAASRLVGELKSALGDGWAVVVSTTTRTGQQLACERFGADRVFYAPLDFGWAVRAYLRALKPAALVLMESELWPRMQHECQRAGVPVIVVNARVSDRSFSRAIRVKSLWSHVLSKPALWLAQTDEDARRLLAMGAREDAVVVGGNLKYDVRAPRQSPVADLIREVSAGRPIIVAGSTVDGDPPEESFVIHAFMAGAHPQFNALLVLAPRHPERFAEAYSIAAEHRVSRATAMLAGESENDPAIILLDTIGDLAAVYGLADLAIVGGSLVFKGGHNPLEPAQFGVPVIMGPSFENFRDIVAKMQAAKAICIINDEEQLEGVMVGMLKDPKVARAMGARGKTVFGEQQGATARAVEAIMAKVRP